MNILLDCEQQTSPTMHVVFGTGLIGTALTQAFLSNGCRVLYSSKGFWRSPEDLRGALEMIEAITKSVESTASSADMSISVNVIWCAGSAGMDSSAEACDAELRMFHRVIDFFEGLAARFSLNVGVILASSAGALFEGQRLVSTESQPKSLRPYGACKLAQEELLLSRPLFRRVSICRLSSVFGYFNIANRNGLIPTIVDNTMRRRQTTIVGRMTTLRDFIWIEDVAKFLCARILDQDPRREQLIVASGKPTSILEIVHTIEKVLRRKVLLNFVKALSNSGDITFSQQVLPMDWRPTSLEVAVKSVYTAWMFRSLANKMSPLRICD